MICMCVQRQCMTHAQQLLRACNGEAGQHKLAACQGDACHLQALDTYVVRRGWQAELAASRGMSMQALYGQLDMYSCLYTNSLLHPDHCHTHARAKTVRSDNLTYRRGHVNFRGNVLLLSMIADCCSPKPWC